MRWGRALEEVLTPGMHFKAPWPMDRIVRVEVSKVRRLEIGFRTREVARAINAVAAEFYATLWESRHAAGTYEKLPEEALRLTGDENIVDMNIVVLYRVSDPYAYVLNVAQVEDLVRFTTESVVSDVAGSLAIEDILTVERENLEETLKAIADKIFEVGVSDPGIQGLLFTARRANLPEADRLYMSWRIPYVMYIERLLKKAVERGEIHEVDPLLTARSFVGLVMDCVLNCNLWAKLGYGDYESCEFVDNNVPIWVRGLLKK